MVLRKLEWMPTSLIRRIRSSIKYISSKFTTRPPRGIQDAVCGAQCSSPLPIHDNGGRGDGDVRNKNLNFYSQMKSDLLLLLEHAETLEDRFQIDLRNGTEGNETEKPLVIHIFYT